MSTKVLPTAPQRQSMFGRSSLTQQLERNEGDHTMQRPESPRAASPKPRSLSDASKDAIKPMLSPSPAFRESRQVSKDDSAVSPTTPRRSTFHTRGLSLQMPNRVSLENSPIAQIVRPPLSPKLETSNIYGSPASMLPRHSRGLDFTRACTNLHHSTLANSTPDASPIAGRSIQIPQRRGTGNSGDSQSVHAGGMWTPLPQEKSTLSSSVSSVNMLGSDSDSDDSSEDMAIDRENDDPMLNTPAATRPIMGLFNNTSNSPGYEWLNNPSPAQGSQMNFSNMLSYRRSRWRKGKSQHSSSSVSMRSSRPSPGPASPPLIKSVESGSEGFFGNLTRQQVQSRRESLSLGTDDLHLSDSEDSENKVSGGNTEASSEGARGVIRRAVTRRSNLLPKTRGFARIKAALLEEAAPIDSDARREAEVVKQVHENDTAFARRPSMANAPLTPIVDQAVESPDDDPLASQNTASDMSARSAESFGHHAERNSAGLGFWHGFDQRYRTPPPTLRPRENSSAISDEAMDTPGSSLANTGENPAWKHFQRSRSRSTTPHASNGPTAEEVARKVNKKRRRDDDFDPSSFKRRAVSPGMSVQSSPILPQSPVLTADKGWGRPPLKAQADRSNSGSSTNGGVKRVGLQGMNETNEGLMCMSID